MELNSLLTLICGFSLVMVGFRVYLLNTKDRLYQSFFLLCILLAWMCVCWYEMSKTSELQVAIYYRRLQSVWAITNPLIMFCIWRYANMQARKLPGWLVGLLFAGAFLPVPYWMYLEIFTELGHGRIVEMPNGNWGLELAGLDSCGWLRLLWSLWVYIPTMIFAAIAWREEEDSARKRWKFGLFLLVVIGLSSTFTQNYLLPLGGVILPTNEALVTFATMAFFGWSFSGFSSITLRPESAFGDVIGSMTNLMIIVDSKFRIREVNPATTQFFKSTKEELIGSSLRTLLGDQDTERLSELVQQSGWATNYEMEITGEENAYLLITAAPIYNQVGTLTGYAIVGTDHTLYEHAVRETQHYTKQLERSNEALERFAYIASHDLKEPLRTVNSFVGLLQTRIRESKDQTALEYMGFISLGVKRMYALIESILEFSKLEQEKSDRTEVDLNEVVGEVRDKLSAILKAKRGKLAVVELPLYKGHQSQFSLLFQNLIENALKYNESSRPHIVVDCRKQDTGYEFSVKDNGIGIPEEFHERVFGMFKRLHNWTQYEGTGMGLAICKKIVEGMGGRIWVESDGTTGTDLKFFLPYV